MSKKVATIFLIFLLFPFSTVLAQPPSEPTGSINVQDTIDRFGIFIWTIFGGIAIFAFVFAGITFLTANGDPGKVKQAREAVIWGIVGVGVALLCNSILVIIQGMLGV